jgi:hypothetical protein
MGVFMPEFEFRLEKGETPGTVVPAVKALDLETLSERIPVITPEAVGFYKQNCMVCLDKNGHPSGVILRVDDRSDGEKMFAVCWNGEVTEQMQRAFRDTLKATDFAACAIALLLIRELTEYTAIEQSAVGTTIDYWLGHQSDADDVLIFNNKARLEVSGILTENKDNTVEARTRAKLRRLSPKGGLPALIAVVEFSQPWSRITQHDDCARAA